MFICLVPMAAIIVFMLFIMQSFTHNYDLIVDDIIKANAYNIEFQERKHMIFKARIIGSGRGMDTAGLWGVIRILVAGALI